MNICAEVLYIAPVCHVQFYNDVKTQFSPQALSAHHPIPHVHIQSSISCSFSHSEPAPSCLHACLKLSYYQGLLNLTVDDLYKLHVEKLGHQEIILESLELLRNFHYNLDQVQPGQFFYKNTN